MGRDLVRCSRRKPSNKSPKCSLLHCGLSTTWRGHSPCALDSDWYVLASSLRLSHAIPIPARPHEPPPPEMPHGFMPTPAASPPITPAASPSIPESSLSSAKSPTEDPPEDPRQPNLATLSNLGLYLPLDSNSGKGGCVLGCLTGCTSFRLCMKGPGPLLPPSSEVHLHSETLLSTG